MRSSLLIAALWISLVGLSIADDAASDLPQSGGGAETEAAPQPNENAPRQVAQLDQNQNTSSSASSAGVASTSNQLQEVTVTAERRAENMQQVPITIQSLTAAQALQKGIVSFDSLMQELPNATFTRSANATNTFIRGVGDASASPSQEPSAAVYVDGVYMPVSNGLTTFDFNNIQSIQVLEGPQGTLFGRNAAAGVIQITTPDPSQELSGKIEAGYGNYDTYSADGYVTGGVTDKLSADVSLLEYDQIDGFGRNLTTNTPTYTERDAAIRSKWLYDFSDATQIRFVADYSNYDSRSPADQYVPASAGLGLAQGAKYAHGPLLPSYDSYNAHPPVNDNMMDGGALTVDHNIGSVMHFQSITSYRWFSGYQTIDTSFAPVVSNSDWYDSHFDAHYVTQEFHLTNLNPGRLTWLVGAFYYGNEVYGSDPRVFYEGPVASPMSAFTSTSAVQNLASGSLFGQTSAAITDTTKFTLGVRYTDERVKESSSETNTNGAFIVPRTTQELRDQPLTWRAVLDQQFTSNILGYVSYNRGFKTGGFNQLSAGSAPYQGEHIDAYEIGMKSQFLDNRLRFNLTGFYYRYTDIQTSISIGTNQLFVNAASARNFGLDEVLDFVATDHLIFSSAVGLLNAKYLSWPNSFSYYANGVKFLIPNAGGDDLPYAPTSSANVSANYHDVMTSIGKFGATVTVAYMDEYYFTPDMGLENPANILLSAAIEWRPPADDSWAVRLWGTNLTNATTYNFGSEGTQGWIVSLNKPRMFGIKVEKDF